MKKALVVMAVLGSVTYGGWRYLGGSSHATDDTRLALDRLWIDHIPVNDRDTIQVFVALTEEPVGVFQAASMWRGSHELFQYKKRGGDLELVFPQTGDRDKVDVKATRCSEDGMDFCLELKGASRGVKRYYSRKGWEIDGSTVDAIEHKLDTVLHPPR